MVGSYDKHFEASVRVYTGYSGPLDSCLPVYRRPAGPAPAVPRILPVVPQMAITSSSEDLEVAIVISRHCQLVRQFCT
jgi:hypothetical protein